jgi:hypothetical protein
VGADREKGDLRIVEAEHSLLSLFSLDCPEDIVDLRKAVVFSLG